jgi:hypothetical protein
MSRFLVAAIVLLTAITLYGVFDCLTRDRQYIRIMPKWAWALVILLVPIVGVLLWYLFGRSSFEGGQRPVARRGPIAPDDDPEYLRKIADDLAADRRRDRRQRKQSEEEPPEAGA